MTNEDLMYASEEDKEFYRKCVSELPSHAGTNDDGLDESGIPIPYSCGSHSVKCFRQILEYVKPKTMLEIGFNIGVSSSMWLNLKKDMLLVSCDISKKKATILAADILKDEYPDRFIYVNRNALSFGIFTTVHKFGLIFIDGSHEKNDVIVDIELALELKIPYIAFDDILPQFGTVQDAIDEYGNLELIFVNGNIALYRNNTA